ncbi:Nicotinate catabolism cluster-specific transcription factor [Colletotrichum shisoi]|uniref:Nicotinate catabolism cluster-specific transcription factor n=1 Tax=Colletotrichum shisoi TaxID=2078593 RepID=A0A5Q4BQG5_9PEZI|nr:Nicotinate catabolism cluster-specific transcription factor [Colletotrichum shisoi]
MNGIDILCDAAGSDMLSSLYSPPEVPKEPAQHPPQQLGKRKLSTSDTSPSSIHVCNICKRVYERADHLTRHLRSHENARPYQCSRCPKRFNRADLLTRHETTHDRDNAGKGRTFIRRSDRAAEACLNCAASKSKCEDAKPCSRCRSKNLPCEVASKRTHPHRSSTDGISTPSETSTMHQSLDTNGGMDPGSAYGGSKMSLVPPNTDMAHEIDAASFMDDGFAGPVIDMVMDDMVNFNPVHNFFQDMDFSSWDLNFDAITIPQPEIDQSPESTTTSRSKSNARNASKAHAAFKRSPWLWEPGPKDYALHYATPQDKERLVLDDGTFANSPAFYKLISTPGTKLKMTSSSRDSLLAMVVASTVQKGNRTRTPSFPSLDLLNHLVQAHFIHDEHRSDSWIHLATFDAAEAIPELLAGILSSGATYISIPAVWQFGFSLQEVLRLGLADLFESSNSSTRDLGALQGYMLSLDIGIWSGFKRKMEIAESFLQPIMTMLRRAGNFSAPPDSSAIIPTLADPPDVLDSKWRKFAKRESYKRLVLHMFFHDIQSSIGFCKNPLMSYTELNFGLPASRDLWRARSAEQWRNLYLAKTNAAPDSPIPRVSEIMHCTEILDDFGQLVDTELCYMALLHGYWGQISAYREATKFYADGISSKRNTTHCLWLKTQYQELYRDLNDFSTMILTSKRPTAQLAVMSEVLMMLLHVSPDVLQTFAGKAGEDEARRTFGRLEESWVTTSEARYAIWHAGQIFHHARQLPPVSLREFNAIAVYFACLTLWAYGLLSCSLSRQSSDQEMGHGTGRKPNSEYILMDSEENRETRAFLQLNRGVPGLTLNGDPADGVESLSNPNVVLSVARDILRNNFPVVSEPLPPLVESLKRLLQDLGSGAAGRPSRAVSEDNSHI